MTKKSIIKCVKIDAMFVRFACARSKSLNASREPHKMNRGLTCVRGTVMWRMSCDSSDKKKTYRMQSTDHFSESEFSVCTIWEQFNGFPLSVSPHNIHQYARSASLVLAHTAVEKNFFLNKIIRSFFFLFFFFFVKLEHNLNEICGRKQCAYSCSQHNLHKRRFACFSHKL